MPQNCGGVSNVNQPTGWRKATAGLAVAEQHAQAGERSTVPKSQAFVAVKRVGAHIGLKAGDVLLLDTLGAFTQAQDWEEGQRPIVWASNAYLMEQTGFSLSALKRHARRLAEIGVIAFKDSPNGKRWGHRDADGRIIEAYGFDLSPLSARAEEFEQLHAELQAERELCQRLKRQITVARRMIRARIEAALSSALGGPWTQLSSLFEDLLDRLPRRNTASETLARLLEWFRELQERVEAAYLTAVRADEGCCHVNQYPAEDGLLGGKLNKPGGGLPDVECFQSMKSDGHGSAAAGLNGKAISGWRMNGNKSLQSARRAKSLHAAFAFPERQVTVFSPVIQTFMGTVFQSRCDVTFRGSIGPQLVGDDPLGQAKSLYQGSQKALCSSFVTPGLKDFLQHGPVLIDGAPKPEFTPRYHHDNLIEVPDIAGAALTAA